MLKMSLVVALVASLAFGQVAAPTDAGTPDGGAAGAVAVRAATLRPEDAPEVELQVGPGVYLPAPLDSEVAAKVRAYNAAEEAAKASAPTVSPVVWVVVGALVLGFGGGLAVGWVTKK